METWNLKRKHHALSLDKKLELIGRLMAGETAASLAEQYNIGKSTISDIWGKKEKLFLYAQKLDMEGGSLKRKTMRTASDARLDESVYQWYTEQQATGHNVTGTMICTRALEIHAELGGSGDFKASSGWLKNFKSRHGIGEGCKSEPGSSSGYQEEGNFYRTEGQYGILPVNIKGLASADSVATGPNIKIEPLVINDLAKVEGSLHEEDAGEQEEPIFQDSPSSTFVGTSDQANVFLSHLHSDGSLERECEMFGKYVAACLMRLPTDRRLSSENAIFRLLMREKVSAYEQGGEQAGPGRERVHGSELERPIKV